MTDDFQRGRTFNDAVRAVFRPAPPPPSDTVRVADLYCGTGELSLAAQAVGLSVVYAEEPDIRVRQEYASRMGFTPDGCVENISFDRIPPFDVLTASLPEPLGQEQAFSRVLRFLRIRRPEAFMLMGEKTTTVPNNGAAEFLQLIRDKTRRLGYQVMGGNEDFGVPDDGSSNSACVVGSLRPIVSEVPGAVFRITDGIGERVPEVQVVLGWLAQHVLAPEDDLH